MAQARYKLTKPVDGKRAQVTVRTNEILLRTIEIITEKRGRAFTKAEIARDVMAISRVSSLISAQDYVMSALAELRSLGYAVRTVRGSPGRVTRHVVVKKAR